jgi:hypothetical protein
MPSWQMISAILAPFGPVDDRECRCRPAPRARPAPTDASCGNRACSAPVVDDQAGIEGIAAGIALHDGKAAPDAVVDAGLLERRHLGPSSEHMIAGLVSMERPCSAYSGNTTRSMVGILRRALPTMATMRCGLRRQIVRRRHHRQLQLHQPQHHAVGSLVQAAKPLISRARSCYLVRSSQGRARAHAHRPQRARDGAGHFVMLSSPGTSRAACFDPAEAIMIRSVRM